LAVFLDAYCPNVEQIVLAIGSLDDVPVDVCISGATTGMRRYLEQQPNVKVWKDYATLLAQAASATALVHHGVQDVAQRCTSLGRPQIVIPWTREQDIFSHATEWMGFSSIVYPTTPIEEMAAGLREALLDQSLTVSAQHHARELASTHLPDALPHIVEQIEASARG
jgi:UDP:flavonoid glycosyltransferase YjiC (YdhE family)